MALATIVLGALTSPPPSGAVAVTVGPPDLTATGSLVSCDGPLCYYGGVLNTALAESGAYLKAPADGTITSWRVHGVLAGGGIISLHVIRPLAGGAYQGIATSQAAIATDGVTDNVAIPALDVRAGDMISLTLAAQNQSGWSAGVYRVVMPGGSVAGIVIYGDGMVASPSGTTTDQELLYNATLDLAEPEAGRVSPEWGPSTGGTVVTITGHHLAPVVAVTFGGVPATSVSGDADTVTAVAPAHAPELVDVVVTTLGGSSLAVPPFEYLPLLSEVAIAPSKFRPARSGDPVSGTPDAKKRIGATVSYALAGDATTTFTVERAKGHGPACSADRKKRCTRWIALPGSFTHAGTVGPNQFSFSGRLGDKALRRGRHRLVGVAQDAAANSSDPATVDFRILAR